MDTDKLAFTSRSKYMRLFKEYEMRLFTETGDTGTVSETHGLGYIPYYQAWVDVQGVLIPAAASGFVSTPDLLSTDVTIRVTEQTITITQLHLTLGSPAYIYYIRIYEDTFA